MHENGLDENHKYRHTSTMKLIIYMYVYYLKEIIFSLPFVSSSTDLVCLTLSTNKPNKIPPIIFMNLLKV